MANLTKEQSDKLKAVAKDLWDAKIRAETALNELEDEGVDMDYEHLPLNNAYTHVDSAITAFHYFAHNWEKVSS